MINTKTQTADEFRAKFGFNQDHPILTNEESIGSKIIKVFSNEEIIPQHFSVSNKRNYYYLPKHKLAIKIDEFGHMDIDKITNKKDKTY